MLIKAQSSGRALCLWVSFPCPSSESPLQHKAGAPLTPGPPISHQGLAQNPQGAEGIEGTQEFNNTPMGTRRAERSVRLDTAGLNHNP